MKNWDYYNTPDVPYFGHAEVRKFERQLHDEINNAPMTATEREIALNDVRKRVQDHIKEKNKPYVAARVKLDSEFWHDAREELGYDKFLNGEGVKLLEQKAWEDGHSSGYSEVYNYLVDLMGFCRQIVKCGK